MRSIFLFSLLLSICCSESLCMKRINMNIITDGFPKGVYKISEEEFEDPKENMSSPLVRKKSCEWTFLCSKKVESRPADHLSARDISFKNCLLKLHETVAHKIIESEQNRIIPLDQIEAHKQAYMKNHKHAEGKWLRELRERPEKDLQIGHLLLIYYATIVDSNLESGRKYYSRALNALCWGEMPALPVHLEATPLPNIGLIYKMLGYDRASYSRKKAYELVMLFPDPIKDRYVRELGERNYGCFLPNEEPFHKISKDSFKMFVGDWEISDLKQEDQKIARNWVMFHSRKKLSEQEIPLYKSLDTEINSLFFDKSLSESEQSSLRSTILPKMRSYFDAIERRIALRKELLELSEISSDIIDDVDGKYRLKRMHVKHRSPLSVQQVEADLIDAKSIIDDMNKRVSQQKERLTGKISKLLSLIEPQLKHYVGLKTALQQVQEAKTEFEIGLLADNCDYWTDNIQQTINAQKAAKCKVLKLFPKSCMEANQEVELKRQLLIDQISKEFPDGVTNIVQMSYSISKYERAARGFYSDVYKIKGERLKKKWVEAGILSERGTIECFKRKKK